MFGPCFVTFVFSTLCPSIDGEERAGSFTLIFFLFLPVALIMFCDSSSRCHELVCSNTESRNNGNYGVL